MHNVLIISRDISDHIEVFGLGVEQYMGKMSKKMKTIYSIMRSNIPKEEQQFLPLVNP